MSMTLETLPEDRFLVFRLLQKSVECPICHTGPVDTTDVGKLITYGKIWDLLSLSDFEGATQEDLIRLFTANELKTVEFKSDTLRYVIDLFFSRSFVINNFFTAIPFIDKLLNLANANNVKINDAGAENLNNANVTVPLTFEQLTGLSLILTANNVCKAEFKTTDNKIVIHGAVLDAPRTLTDYNKYHSVLSTLKLLNVLVGRGQLATYEGAQDYTFTVSEKDYLLNLVAKRSVEINFPQHKLAAIINLLN